MRPRLFVHIASLQARNLMSYRADFWITTILGFFVQLGVIYYLWEAVFAESGSDRIGGYTFHGILLYYVLVLLLGKIVRGVDREGDMSREIYSGELTRYIVYPTSYPLIKYAQRIGDLVPAFMQLGLFGALCPFFFDLRAEADISPASVLMTVVALGVANLLHFTLYWPTEGVAFWADNVWSLNVMMRFAISLTGGLMLPLSVFPDWARELLQYLPFRYLYDFPVNVLLGRVGVGEWLQGLVVSLLWFGILVVVSRAVWRRGALQYTGVGI